MRTEWPSDGRRPPLPRPESDARPAAGDAGCTVESAARSTVEGLSGAAGEQWLQQQLLRSKMGRGANGADSVVATGAPRTCVAPVQTSELGLEAQLRTPITQIQKVHRQGEGSKVGFGHATRSGSSDSQGITTDPPQQPRRYPSDGSSPAERQMSVLMLSVPPPLTSPAPLRGEAGSQNPASTPPQYHAHPPGLRCSSPSHFRSLLSQFNETSPGAGQIPRRVDIDGERVSLRQQQPLQLRMVQQQQQQPPSKAGHDAGETGWRMSGSTATLSPSFPSFSSPQSGISNLQSPTFAGCLNPQAEKTCATHCSSRIISESEEGVGGYQRNEPIHEVERECSGDSSSPRLGTAGPPKRKCDRAAPLGTTIMTDWAPLHQRRSGSTDGDRRRHGAEGAELHGDMMRKGASHRDTPLLRSQHFQSVFSRSGPFDAVSSPGSPSSQYSRAGQWCSGANERLPPEGESDVAAGDRRRSDMEPSGLSWNRSLSQSHQPALFNSTTDLRDHPSAGLNGGQTDLPQPFTPHRPLLSALSVQSRPPRTMVRNPSSLNLCVIRDDAPSRRTEYAYMYSPMQLSNASPMKSSGAANAVRERWEEHTAILAERLTQSELQLQYERVKAKQLMRVIQALIQKRPPSHGQGITGWIRHALPAADSDVDDERVEWLSLKQAISGSNPAPQLVSPLRELLRAAIHALQASSTRLAVLLTSVFRVLLSLVHCRQHIAVKNCPPSTNTAKVPQAVSTAVEQRPATAGKCSTQ